MPLRSSNGSSRLFVGGFFPDAALMHQGDLFFDYCFAVFLMLHRRAAEIEVFGVDRLLIQNLIKLGAQVFYPVVPLRAVPMVTQGLDIDYPGYVGRRPAVLLLADNLAAVI